MTINLFDDKSELDPNKWIRTLPGNSSTNSNSNSNLNTDKWVKTIPKKEGENLHSDLNPNSEIKSTADSITNQYSKLISYPRINLSKKYSLTAIVFVIGIVLITVTKNETRNLQKEIGNLQASISTLKTELHKANLEHEVITSPENISRLAEEYLESDFTFYKKSQIRNLNEDEKFFSKMKKKKNGINKKTIEIKIAKKIEMTKTELRKLQDIYESPKDLPREIRYHVSKKIQTKKDELQKLYSNPTTLFTPRMQRWAGIQIVKVFLGIPIVPGK